MMVNEVVTSRNVTFTGQVQGIAPFMVDDNSEYEKTSSSDDHQNMHDVTTINNQTLRVLRATKINKI